MLRLSPRPAMRNSNLCKVGVIQRSGWNWRPQRGPSDLQNAAPRHFAKQSLVCCEVLKISSS